MVRVDELVIRWRDLREDPEPTKRVLARERAQRAVRNGRAAYAVVAVAARDHVALEIDLLASMPKANSRPRRLELVHADLFDLEEKR